MADNNKPIEYRLTTKDNPFDPFKEFDKWWNYDTNILHYNTCGLIDRLAKTSSSMSDYDNLKEIERVIDEIIRLNVKGLEYIKVPKPAN